MCFVQKFKEKNTHKKKTHIFSDYAFYVSHVFYVTHISHLSYEFYVSHVFYVTCVVVYPIQAMCLCEPYFFILAICFSVFNIVEDEGLCTFV